MAWVFIRGRKTDAELYGVLCFWINLERRLITVRDKGPHHLKSTEQLSHGLLLYGYAIALGAAYIFAFWRPLGFNIFPYLGAIDLLTAPINRLLALFAPFILLFIAQAETNSKSPLKLPFYSIVIIMLLHCFVGVKEILKAFEVFSKFDFHFDNEKSILVFCSLFMLFSLILAFRIIFERNNIYLIVCAVGLAQISIALATGYTDGKPYLTAQVMCIT